jgi:hypothetical protein
MIDRPARSRLAELIRGLVAGRITNDDFDESGPRGSHDSAVDAVFFDGAWGLYDDLHEHRLKGRWRLSDGSRYQVARWILFLEGDLEYEWPTFGGWRRLGLIVSNLVTLGLARIGWRRWYGRHGDLAVWPFIRKADYEAALGKRPYLAGAR